LLFLIIVILFFNFTGAGDYFRNGFLKISSPLRAAFWSRGISLHPDKIEGSDRDILLSEIVRLRRKEGEVDELRTALEIDLSSDFNLVDGRVVGRATEGDQLIISRGREDDIFEGMPVVTSSGALVGEITEALPDFSHIRLITHPDSEFEAEVQDRENSLGVISADNQLRLEMVDREAQIEEGDMVVSFPGGGIYPGGIFIGEIEEVIRDDVEAFQSATINPGFGISDFNILFIITDF